MWHVQSPFAFHLYYELCCHDLDVKLRISDTLFPTPALPFTARARARPSVATGWARGGRAAHFLSNPGVGQAGRARARDQGRSREH